MSEHTEGKIEAFTEESFSGWFALRQITDDGLNHEIGSGDGGLFEPDARRLAAAWNAFEGMTTKSIEESMGCDGVIGIICYAGDTQEELNAAQSRIASLESQLAERDAWLGQRPCRNSRCNELNAARALLREVADNIGSVTPFTIEKPLGERIRSYLDACDTLEGK